MFPLVQAAVDTVQVVEKSGVSITWIVGLVFAIFTAVSSYVAAHKGATKAVQNANATNAYSGSGTDAKR